MPTRRHMHQGVVDQVGQRFGKLRLVPFNRLGQTVQRLKAQVNAPRARQGPQAPRHPFGQRLQVQRRQAQRRGIGARQGQHLVGLANGVVHLLLDRLQGLLSLAGLLLAQRKTHLRCQRGQRRAQLVRSVVDKTPLRFQGAQVAAGVLVERVHQRAYICGHGFGIHGRQVAHLALCNVVLQALQRAQGEMHHQHHQPQSGQQQQHIARHRLQHQAAGEVLPAFQRFGHLDHHPPGVRSLGKRAVKLARVRADANRRAKVVAVVKLRLPVHQRLGRWRQPVVANLHQAVAAGDAVEHLPAGGQLKKFQCPVGKFHRQAATGGGNVGIHRLDGAQQRAVKSGVGGSQRVAPAHHDVQAGDGKQTGHQHRQQGAAQAPVRPAQHAQAPDGRCATVLSPGGGMVASST